MLSAGRCGSGGGVAVLSAGRCDTRGSGVVSSAVDLLDMSVVCGLRGIGGVCEMCMCLAWGRWDVCGKRIGFGLYQFCRKSGWLGQGLGLCVWSLCVDGRSRYLYIVLDVFRHNLGAPSVQLCCPLWISAS